MEQLLYCLQHNPALGLIVYFGALAAGIIAIYHSIKWLLKLRVPISRFGRGNVPISEGDYSFIDEIIQHSKYTNLKGRRREKKIQKLANELSMNIILMNLRNLSPEQKEEYRRLAVTHYPQVDAFLEKNIPDYLEKQTTVLVDFARKYEK
jgi:hypothetical protein